MQIATALAQGISIVSFAGYGISCFVSARMVTEFERYGLARLRGLIGALQLAGSVGLVAGFFSRPLLLLAAGGLAAMMFVGILVRVRIRDPLSAMLPAFAFFCLNLFLVISAR